MKSLTTYRDNIKTYLAAITTVGGAYSFTMATTTTVLDDVRNVATKALALFPRAYVYTPHGVDLEMLGRNEEWDDISDASYWVKAPIIVDCWRYLAPGDDLSSKCDYTAADIIECITKNAYWATNKNTVQIDAKSVKYSYYMDNLICVSLRFEVMFRFNKKDQ